MSVPHGFLVLLLVIDFLITVLFSLQNKRVRYGARTAGLHAAFLTAAILLLVHG